LQRAVLKPTRTESRETYRKPDEEDEPHPAHRSPPPPSRKGSALLRSKESGQAEQDPNHAREQGRQRTRSVEAEE
jgi:hypothetical protein